MPLHGKIPDVPLGPPLEVDTLKLLEHDIGVEEVRRIMLLFRETLNNYRDQISTNLAARDLSQVKRTAHGLKGLCMQFGATHAIELARLLELHADNVEDAKIVLGRFVAEVERVEKFIAPWKS